MDVEVNINKWRQYKKIYSNADHFSQLDLAKATFFLNRTNVSGVITGGMIGRLGAAKQVQH
jgi:DNA adenine methylase